MKACKGLIIFLNILLVFICNQSLFSEDESAQIEVAKTKLKGFLRDPDSAIFQNLNVTNNSKGDECVCGEVNARNAFGGYPGFAKFNVSGDKVNIVDFDRPETIKLYRLSGCAGPDAELEARLEEEAEFSCAVIWTLLSNVIVEEQKKEEAVDAAIAATKNRAKENGTKINDEQIEIIKAQYFTYLDETLANKKQVKAIQKSPEYQKRIFLPACCANTTNVLKEQIRK